MLDNKVWFGLENDDDGWRIWYKTAIGKGDWSAPRRISKPYNTKGEAVADMGNYFTKLGIRNWIVYFETY